MGTVRVIARYLVFDRPADMVFYFTVPGYHAPTADDVFAIAHNYVDWERGGLGFLDGYSMLRSDQSALVATEAQSIDRTGEAFLYVDAAQVYGEVHGVEATCLPTTLCPLIYWELELGAQRRAGRTYAVGFAASQTGTSDRMQLESADRLDLVSTFDLLRTSMADSGATMVLPRYSVGGVTPSPAPTYVVTSCFNVDKYLSSRRRRSKGVTGQAGPL